MKTLNSIKNFGRKTLVGGLILTGLAGLNCSVDNNVTDVLEIKIGDKYTAKSVINTKQFDNDNYTFLIEDSTGNRILQLYFLSGIKPIAIEVKDNNTFKTYKFGEETHYLENDSFIKREEIK